MASFRIEDILARPHGPASHSSGRSSESGSGIGVPTPIPSYQQLSFGVEQILSRHDNEQREPRLPLLGKRFKEAKQCSSNHEFFCTCTYVTIVLHHVINKDMFYFVLLDGAVIKCISLINVS